MALDASIYARFAPAAKSVTDFDREYEDLQGARTGNALRSLTLQQGQRAEQDAQRVLGEQTGVRNALQALGGGATDEQRVNALRGLGTQTGFGQADALEKSLLERQKTRAEVTGKESEVRKRDSDIATDAIKRYRGALDFIDTPDGAARWMQAQYADPALARQMQALGPLDQALTRIPTDAQAFAQWRAQAALGMDGYMQRLGEAATRAETATNNQRVDARIRSEGAANRAVTMRGQNLVDSRQREINTTTKQTATDAKREASVEKAITKFSDTLQKEGIPELETAIGGAEGAIGRYKEGEVPGLGRLAGAVPSALLGDEGNDVRQAVAAVRNIVLNARSGAAVTDQELRRLVEELGTGVGQSEAAVRRGLKRVRDRLDKIKENAAAGVNDDVLQTYQERGGIAIKRGGKGTAPAAQAAAGGFKYLGTE
jgi:hypothetical protein